MGRIPLCVKKLMEEQKSSSTNKERIFIRCFLKKSPPPNNAAATTAIAPVKMIRAGASKRSSPPITKRQPKAAPTRSLEYTLFTGNPVLVNNPVIKIPEKKKGREQAIVVAKRDRHFISERS